MENNTKEVKVCAACGCIIEDEDYFEHDGEFYCSDCASEIFYSCDNCGDIVHQDDIYEVITSLWRPRSVYVCGDCRDRYTTTCPHCGRLFFTNGDLLSEVDNGSLVCDDCRDDRYWYCENCETYHQYGEDCPNEENRIKSYHDHHYSEPEFYGVGRLFTGIELEVDRNRFDGDAQNNFLDAIESIAGDRLYFEHDGSLRNGFEIISEPHTPKEFCSIDWAAIFRAGIENGYSSHDIGTCGLHIHINRNFFGNDEVSQARGIAKMLYFYENWADEVVKFSRRSQEQLGHWAGFYGIYSIEDCLKYAKGDRYVSRYHCVNLTNDETVEIRIMRGTLNFETFMATYDFVTRIARNAAKLSYKDIYNLDAWMSGMKPETIEYMHRRHCFGK